jgi:sugar diacid utilization regulator
VLITGTDGIVIGSGDTGRIGTLHEASLQVMRTLEPAWHNAEQARRLTGVRPGMTLPIILDGIAVGTVGITGSPRQVRQFGLVVQRQTDPHLPAGQGRDEDRAQPARARRGAAVLPRLPHRAARAVNGHASRWQTTSSMMPCGSVQKTA